MAQTMRDWPRYMLPAEYDSRSLRYARRMWRLDQSPEPDPVIEAIAELEALLEERRRGGDR